jgi:hypothetical protein
VHSNEFCLQAKVHAEGEGLTRIILPVNEREVVSVITLLFEDQEIILIIRYNFLSLLIDQNYSLVAKVGLAKRHSYCIIESTQLNIESINYKFRYIGYPTCRITKVDFDGVYPAYYR